MKLILMTTPYFFVEEHQIINALFDEGLEILHLRKPETEPVYSERLLTLIDESYRKRIVVHDHFYLKNEYNLKGIHLNQRNPELPPKYKGHLSCSCRTEQEVTQHKKACDYVFLSKRFSPPSKPPSIQYIKPKTFLSNVHIQLSTFPYFRPIHLMKAPPLEYLTDNHVLSYFSTPAYRLNFQHYQSPPGVPNDPEHPAWTLSPPLHTTMPVHI